MAKFDFNTPITKDINLYAMYNCTEINPDNPTIENLQLALATGNPSAYYPIGSGIAGTYGGKELAWQIVHYGTALVASTGVITPGAYLLSAPYLATGQYGNVTSIGGSAIYTNMNKGGTWYNNTDEAVRKAMVPVEMLTGISSSGAGYTTFDFFMPSCTNLGMTSGVPDTELVWDYFSDSDSQAKRPKVGLGVSATNGYLWTRDRIGLNTSSYNCFFIVTDNGRINGSASTTTLYTNTYGIPFACFIPDPTYQGS